ncbi:MAG: zinc-ribbon domain-containing protein [Thermodesulfobacteriota bacterium]
MIIQCVNCKVKYNIDDNKIKPPGIKVKCSKCAVMFFVDKNSPLNYDKIDFSSNLESKTVHQDSFNVNTNEDYSNDFSSKFPTDNGIDGGFDFDDAEEKLSNEENKIEISGNFDTTDVNTQTENMELQKVDAIDWENPEIYQLEQNNDLPKIDELNESNYEINKDVLEVDSSKTFIKEEIKPRQHVNPLRSQLSPDLSGSASDYNIVSSTANNSSASRETSMDTINSGSIYQSRKKKRKGFFSNLLTNFLYLIVLIILFTTVLFSLITFGVIPKDQYKKYFSIVTKYFPTPESEADKRLKNLSVTDLKGKWVNTKNGFLFVVQGKVTNNDIAAVSYIKLKSRYYSAGENLYEQEFYSGNTLSFNDLKNKSVSSLKEKLSRKSGDVDFDDINTFAGKNYNIKPGESVFFYTFYLSKSKILGLKYDIEVLDFEPNNI